MSDAGQRRTQKQAEKRKGQHQCNLGYVSPEFAALLAEMRIGFSSNEACIFDALKIAKRLANLVKYESYEYQPTNKDKQNA